MLGSAGRGATLTDDLTGLLVVELSVPVKEPEQREGEQEHKANPHEHVRRESREVQALGTGTGTGGSTMGLPTTMRAPSGEGDELQQRPPRRVPG